VKSWFVFAMENAPLFRDLFLGLSQNGTLGERDCSVGEILEARIATMHPFGLVIGFSDSNNGPFRA